MNAPLDRIPAATPPQAAPDASDPRGTVLVIDDEYGARLQVELALLTSESARLVAQATNGARGAEAAERLQPDVIVLDLNMPVMDGFEALPLLRAVSPRSVILVRSNNDDPKAAAEALRLGASRFLPKFMDPERLRQAIEESARRELPDHLRQVLQAAPAMAASR